MKHWEKSKLFYDVLVLKCTNAILTVLYTFVLMNFSQKLLNSVYCFRAGEEPNKNTHMKKVTTLAKRACHALMHKANERHHLCSPCHQAREDAAVSTVLILSSRFHLDLRQLKLSFSLSIYKHHFIIKHQGIMKCFAWIDKWLLTTSF